jgi:hypothetical protein
MTAPTFIGSLAVAVASVFTLHWPTLYYGLTLGDEGYLWYGTLEVRKGKVPIRDFRAYDLGRYYWCAFLMLLLGSRNRSVRIAMMLIQVGGVWLAAVLVHTATHSWLATILWSFAITACMRPWYRSIEPTFGIAGVALGVMLLSDPMPSQAMAIGFFVALSILAGLNLAIYNGGGALIAACLALRSSTASSPAVTLYAYLTGVAVGLGMLVMVFAIIPGFLRAYWQKKVLAVLRRGTTNLPLPLPWLWRKTPQPQGRFIKTCFTGLPFFYAGSLVWLMLNTAPSSSAEKVFAAAVCVGIFYFHYALSRANADHLFPAIPPSLIAAAPLVFSNSLGWLLGIAITAAVFRYVHSRDDLFRAHGQAPSAFCRYRVDGDLLWVPKTLAADLDAMRQVVNLHTAPGEPALFVPTLVTLYPLFARRPAAYDVFCVYPADRAAQEEMIASITQDGLRLALVWDGPTDWQDDRRFRNTHPLVWNQLQAQFQPVPLMTSDGDLRCFIKKCDEHSGI